MTVKRKVIPKLEIHKRGKLVDSFLLNTPRLVIGSAPGAHIRLRSAEVETEHLVIELVNRRFLEAVNVAGDPHLRHQGEGFERVRLGKGSVITLGPLAFKLVFVPRDPTQPRRSTDPASIEADTIDRESLGAEPPAPPSAPRRPAPALHEDITDPGAGLATPPAPVAPPVPEPEPEPEPEPVTEPEPVAETVAETVVETVAETVAETGRMAAPPVTEPERMAAPPVTDAEAEAGETVESPAVGSPAEAEEPAVFLLVYPPAEERRKRVRLPVGTYTIGREECDINLHYEGIAGVHATLMVMPDGNVYVQDKASGLPTIVNGQVVDLSPFQPGDSLQVGAVRFELDPRGMPAKPPPPVAAPAPDAGAGAWVQAAMDSPARAPGDPTPSTASMPVRKIGDEERRKARSVGTATDPHVSARQWVRAAITETGKRDAGEVKSSEKAPSFATPPKDKPTGPRPRRPQPAQTGPERVAAARFPEWATTTIPPEYRARRRRRRLLSTFVVLVLIGVPAILLAWHRGRGDGDRDVLPADSGSTDEDADIRSVLANTDGAYSGLRSSDGDEGSSRRKSSRKSRRDRDRKKRSSGSSDDGVVMNEAGEERSGPTYGPGGRITGVDRDGAGWGPDPTSDPDLIAIGNPGPNAPILEFGSPHLGGMMVEEDDGGEVRRVEQELEFELDEDSAPDGRGSVDMDLVEGVLRSLTPSVRACYDRALESEPDLQGTMVLILTLGTSGQITSSTLDVTSSSLTNTDLKRCVERQVKSRNYPIPEGGQITFSYPFRFNR